LVTAIGPPSGDKRKPSLPFPFRIHIYFLALFKKHVIGRICGFLEYSEIWQKILICQPVSEIPPNPPLIKGGQGGFLASLW
jgi:hypothetical protein